MTTPDPPRVLNPITGRMVKPEYLARILRGQALGKSYQASRGQGLRPGPGGVLETESQRRIRISRERYGLSPSQRRSLLIRQQYGVSEYRYRRFRKDLEWINEHSSPEGQIQPWMIQQAAQMEATGVVDPGWIEAMLAEKRRSIQAYIDMPVSAGKYRKGPHHVGYHFMQNRIPFLPIQWWWYHGT